MSECIDNDPGTLSFGYSTAALGCGFGVPEGSPATVDSVSPISFSISIIKSLWSITSRSEVPLTCVCLSSDLDDFGVDRLAQLSLLRSPTVFFLIYFPLLGEN